MITTRQRVSHKVEAGDGFLLITSGEIKCKIPFDQLSEKLKNASEMERQIFVLSPSGYGIHWPLIDEDLAIEQLLKDYNS